MRTLNDLDQAFAELDQIAEAYLDAGTGEADSGATHGATGDPSTPVDLVPVSRPRRIRPWVAAAAAAGLAAAIAVGATALVGRSPDKQPAASAPQETTYREVARTVNFTLDPKLHVKAGDLTMSGEWEGSLAAQLYDRKGRQAYQLIVLNPDDGSRLSRTGLSPVTVGKREAYYSDGSGPGLVRPDHTPPGERSSENARYGSMVVWRYADDAWAMVMGQNSRPTKAQLVTMARGVWFGGKHTVRSIVRVANAPAGMHLVGWEAIYRSEAVSTKVLDRTGERQTLLQYRPAEGGTGVSVDAYNGGSDAVQGTPVRVGARNGYWNARNHQLTVELGHGVLADVSLVSASDRQIGSRDALVRVANQLHLTATTHQREPARWYDLRTAAP